MKLSIVSTLYNSEKYISQFLEQVNEAAKKFFDEFEIILVNDGSPDESLKVSLDFLDVYKNIRVIDLSRNFGHHKAMMTGLMQCQGDFVFLIDSDLEEDPCWLGSFYEVLESTRCDVVYGVQEKRKGGFLERHTGNLFYFILNLLTSIKIPQNLVTARLMTRRYVNALIKHTEREVFIAGLWEITGFVQLPKIVKKKSGSETTYTIKRKFSLLVNSVTSFSNIPLVTIFYSGISILVFSVLYITYLSINWMFFSNPMSGWTSLIASVWLLGGLIISFIGITGIYISKIFSEVKQRPYTIIKEIYEYQKHS